LYLFRAQTRDCTDLDCWRESRVVSCTWLLRNQELFTALDCYRNRELTVHW